jgi:hypothetical protein
MSPFKLITLGFLALLGAGSPFQASAAAGATVRVVEFYDAGPGHFFMTADPLELEGLAARTFGPSFIRTGLSFDVLPAGEPVCETSATGQVTCAQPVCRFHYATLPADWYFYSSRPGDCSILRQPGSGFIDQGTAFQAFVPVGGACTGGRVPVYRSYRNQNHRFTADRAAHLRGVAAGAADEGIEFCAEAANELPVFDAPFLASEGRDIFPLDECSPEGQGAACVAARNIRPPFAYEGDFEPATVPQPFVDRTGFRGPRIYTDGEPILINRASRTFVQFGSPGQVGLNVNHADALDSRPAGLDIFYNFDRFTPPGAIDRRLFPFLNAVDVPVDLSMRFTLFVNAVNLTPGSVAGGRLRILFADEAGRSFDLVVPLYGTARVTTGGVSRAPDGHLVITALIDSDSLFGRQTTRLPFLLVPGEFRSANPWGYGGVFEYRITATDLQRMVNAVRLEDSAFLPSGGLYQVLGYRIENDVEGIGSLGLNVSDVSLRLVRR